MRYTIIYLIFMYLAPNSTLAQTTSGQLVWQAKEIKMPTGQRKNLVKFSAADFKLSPGPPLQTTYVKIAPIPADYNYNKGFGWVCQQEWKLEKKTAIPLKIRLGSKEQVDYLEGKFDHSPH